MNTIRVSPSELVKPVPDFIVADLADVASRVRVVPGSFQTATVGCATLVLQPTHVRSGRPATECHVVIRYHEIDLDSLGFTLLMEDGSEILEGTVGVRGTFLISFERLAAQQTYRLEFWDTAADHEELSDDFDVDIHESELRIEPLPVKDELLPVLAKHLRTAREHGDSGGEIDFGRRLDMSLQLNAHEPRRTEDEWVSKSPPILPAKFDVLWPNLHIKARRLAGSSDDSPWPIPESAPATLIRRGRVRLVLPTETTPVGICLLLIVRATELGTEMMGQKMIVMSENRLGWFTEVRLSDIIESDALENREILPEQVVSIPATEHLCVQFDRDEVEAELERERTRADADLSERLRTLLNWIDLAAMEARFTSATQGRLLTVQPYVAASKGSGAILAAQVRGGRPGVVIPTAMLRDHLSNPLHMLLDGATAHLHASLHRDDAKSQIESALQALGRQMRSVGWVGSLFEPIVRQFLPESGSLQRVRPLEAAVAWAVTAAKEAGEHALRQVKDHLSKIAEDWQASSASTWLLDEHADQSRSVVPLVARNNHRSAEVFAQGYPVKNGVECGFIPLTAHSGQVVAVSNLERSEHKRFYKHGVNEAVAEICVPFGSAGAMTEFGDDRVEGVLDLQFRKPCKVNRESELTPGQLLLKDALRLLPDLVVLECLRRGDASWCPWHPEIHGWDFRKSLECLCHKVCNAIIPDGVTFTIWYADWDRGKLFAYATDGYDFEYRDRKELDLYNSRTGSVALGETAMEVINDPAVEFVEDVKAEAMGVYKAFIARIPVPGQKRDPERPSLGTVNLYFYGDSKEREDVRACLESVGEWLPTLARFVGQMAVAFSTLRHRFALNVLTQKLDEQPVDQRSTKAHFDVLREFLKIVFGERVKVSLWARWENRFYCVGTDGLYWPEPRKKSKKNKKCDSLDINDIPSGDVPFLYDEWGPLYYDLDEPDHQGMTTLLGGWKEGGTTPDSLRLQIDTTGHGVADSTRYSSHRLREHFGIRGNFARWFLGATVKDSQKQVPVGVIRVVRPGKPFKDGHEDADASCKPFTRCDQELLKALASNSAWLFEWWNHEMRDFKERRKPGAAVATAGFAAGAPAVDGRVPGDNAVASATTPVSDQNHEAADRTQQMGEFDSIREETYSPKSCRPACKSAS